MMADLVWLAVILLVAWFADGHLEDLFWTYLIGFVGCSPHWLDESLMIPLAACAAYYRYKTIWIYFLACTGLYVANVLQGLGRPLVSPVALDFCWDHLFLLQLPLLAFLIVWGRDAARRTLPAEAAPRR